MEVVIKETGELREVTPIFDDPTFDLLYWDQSNDVNYTPEQVRIPDWEQRRYELSRDVLRSMRISKDDSADEVAEFVEDVAEKVLENLRCKAIIPFIKPAK